MKRKALTVWLYSRSRADRLCVLHRQMEDLREEAERCGYTVVGASQDMCHGKALPRKGLREALRAVRIGTARAVVVQELCRLGTNRRVLLCVLKFLQSHNAVLIATATDTDLRYELHLAGLEQPLLRRAARKGCGVPWQGVSL